MIRLRYSVYIISICTIVPQLAFGGLFPSLRLPPSISSFLGTSLSCKKALSPSKKSQGKAPNPSSQEEQAVSFDLSDINQTLQAWLEQESLITTDFVTLNSAIQLSNIAFFEELRYRLPKQNRMILQNAFLEQQIPLGPMLRYCAPELFNEQGDISLKAELPSARVFTQRYIQYTTEVLGIPRKYILVPGTPIKNKVDQSISFISHLDPLPDGYELTYGTLTDLEYYTAIQNGILPVSWSNQINSHFRLPMILHELGHLSGLTHQDYLLAIRYTAIQMIKAHAFFSSKYSDEIVSEGLRWTINSFTYGVYDFFEHHMQLEEPFITQAKELIDTLKVGSYASSLTIGNQEYTPEMFADMSSEELQETRIEEIIEDELDPIIRQLQRIFREGSLWLGGSVADGYTLTNAKMPHANPYYKFYRDQIRTLMNLTSHKSKKAFRIKLESIMSSVNHLKFITLPPSQHAQNLLDLFNKEIFKQLQQAYRKDDFIPYEFESYEKWLKSL